MNNLRYQMKIAKQTIKLHIYILLLTDKKEREKKLRTHECLKYELSSSIPFRETEEEKQKENKMVSRRRSSLEGIIIKWARYAK